MPWGLQFNPMLLMSSGQPYDVTTGTDLNGDSFASDRPAFATDLLRPSVAITLFGAFDTVRRADKLVPRDYLVGPGFWNLNARLQDDLFLEQESRPVQALDEPLRFS